MLYLLFHNRRGTVAEIAAVFFEFTKLEIIILFKLNKCEKTILLLI